MGGVYYVGCMIFLLCEGMVKNLSGILSVRLCVGVRVGSWFFCFVWVVLIYNLLVILWGVVVCLIGVGVGCGDYWLLCNGVVIFLSFILYIIIEFSYCLISGVSGLFVIGLVVLVFW